MCECFVRENVLSFVLYDDAVGVPCVIDSIVLVVGDSVAIQHAAIMLLELESCSFEG